MRRPSTSNSVGSGRKSPGGHAPTAAAAATTAADDALERMGYKAELPRSLSMISVLGLSFAIMAVPYGKMNTG